MDWISLDLAKSFLRVDQDEEDPVVQMLIVSARSQVETYTGLRLIQQSATLTLNDWRDLAALKIGPVKSVTAITYLDQVGAQQTLAPSAYRLVVDGLRASIRPKPGVTLPTTLNDVGAITVNLTVGYGPSASSIPGAVNQALLLTLGDAYAYREGTVAERSVTPVELPNGIPALLANFRVF